MITINLNLITKPANTMSMEDLVISEALLATLIGEMEARERAIPAALTQGLNDITKEINIRSEDDLKRRLQLLKHQKDQLTPRAEKLSQTDAEIKALEKQLGINQPQEATTSKRKR